MILILSDDRDYSTNMVIDWIVSFGKPVVRINSSNEVEITKIEINSGSIDYSFKSKMHNGEDVFLNKNSITSYWYRRGHLRLIEDDLKLNNNSFEKELNSELKNQSITMIDFLHYYLNSKTKHIGAYIDNQTNKLINLSIARDIGLDIPDSKILNNKLDLINFLNVKGKLISKPVSQGSAYGYISNLSGLTMLINKAKIKHLDDYLYYSPILGQNS